MEKTDDRVRERLVPSHVFTAMWNCAPLTLLVEYVSNVSNAAL